MGGSPHIKGLGWTLRAIVCTHASTVSYREWGSDRVMASGGYEYDFPGTLPDRIVCKICHCPSRNPYLSVCCGHVFCKSCIDQVKRASSALSILANAACPMCRDEDFPSVPNKQIDREVQSLIISCTNKEKGCTWKGEVRAVEPHKKACQFETVSCEYHNVGCKAKMCRKDLKQHNKLKVEEHLALSTSRLHNLECLVYRFLANEISATSDEGDAWCMQLDSLATITASSEDQVCPVIVKMSGFATVKENEEKWFSAPFFTHDKGYKMCLCVDTDGFYDNSDSVDDDDDDSNNSTYLSVSFYLMKGPYDGELTWPLMGKFEIKLLNQVDDSGHHSDIVYFDDDTPFGAVYRVMDNDQAAEGFGEDEFISHDDFYDISSSLQYIKNDSIFFQVVFEISES